MATLAETLGIYRDILSEDIPSVPTIGAKTTAPPGSAAYNDAQRIAANVNGQTTQAQQDLAAAKENVPVVPSDRTPQQQAQLDKAKGEVEGLPLDGVTTTESVKSCIARALIGESAIPNEYKALVLTSIASWLKRNMPEAKRMIWLFSGQAPDLADKAYQQILLPRIVKWDFPQNFSLEYYDMIQDLIKTLGQQKP